MASRQEVRLPMRQMPHAAVFDSLQARVPQLDVALIVDGYPWRVLDDQLFGLAVDAKALVEILQRVRLLAQSVELGVRVADGVLGGFRVEHRGEEVLRIEIVRCPAQEVERHRTLIAFGEKLPPL